MELANEDSLRLNVLLHQNAHAIRIDESSMTVHALTERGEAKVKLNPTCRDDRYLSHVRELVSTHVLGSPGGYPVYLKRWTRMGQARDESLAQLLLLGEPEAVVAVVHAAGLTDELARRAWWCLPNADNARRMLEKPTVAAGCMGKILAEFLVEYLPFETESKDIIDSVQWVLQPGLIDDATRIGLWNKARRKNAYFVGFVRACPMQLPEPLPANPKLSRYQTILQAAADSRHARWLRQLWSAQGQRLLDTVITVLKKPNDQDVVVKLLQGMQTFFQNPKQSAQSDITGLAHDCECALRQPELQNLIQANEALRAELQALLLLSHCGEALVNPIFARTSAIGSVMRSKLEPVSGPLIQACRQLLQTAS